MAEGHAWVRCRAHRLQRLDVKGQRLDAVAPAARRVRPLRAVPQLRAQTQLEAMVQPEHLVRVGVGVR